MTRPAFTLGPWKVGTHNPHSVHATGPRGFTLCDLGGIYPEKDANARLIAAAPELYEALDRINVAACYASEEDTDAREAVLLHIGELARAALAKAQGAQS